MALPQHLIEELHRLNRAEKRQAIRLLLDELSAEDDFAIKPGPHFEVRLPVEAGDAISVITKLLEEDKVV